MTFFSNRRELLRGSAFMAAALPSLPISAGQSTQDTRTIRSTPASLFNVKDYGASGVRAGDSGPAIQRAIEACSAAGGGIVYLPPGEYTSGTLYLRSHIRFHLEAGATLYASQNPEDFNGKPTPGKAALLFGQKLDNVTIEGRGTVNGQAEYEHRIDDIDDAFVRPAKERMKALGKSTIRSFPKGSKTRTVYPHLVWMGECTNVLVTGVSFLYSPSWSLTFHQCDRLNLDGIYVHTKLNEAVWADGIDLDGCKDVCVANSTIVSGDDCLAIFSGDFWGPARACEDITITNCRLSSSSWAVKFTEGNVKGVHRVTISNCVITDDSGGFTFLSSDGGDVSDVLISNVILNLRRFDWFWTQYGPMGFDLKRRSEWAGEPVKAGGPSPGSIRNVVIRDLIIHAAAPCRINGHPDSWIEGLTLENIKLFLRTDPDAAFDWTVHAMEFHYARGLKLRNVEIHWEEPALESWQSALYFENVERLKIEGFEGRQAWMGRDTAALVFKEVKNAMVRDSTPSEGTDVFLQVLGGTSEEICLVGNDFRRVPIPYRIGDGVKRDAVRTLNNVGPSEN
jgi:polygalacturonase